MEYIDGKRFREMRREMKLTQETVARWFGTEPGTIARWEKGQSRIFGPAQILMWWLYDEQVNGNLNAVRDYMNDIGIGFDDDERSKQQCSRLSLSESRKSKRGANPGQSAARTTVGVSRNKRPRSARRGSRLQHA